MELMDWEKMKEHGKMEERAMRKIIGIFAAALVMLAVVGCEKNETLPDNSSKVITLSATINNGGTKTSLGALENGEYPVLWSEGDAIAIIQNGTKYEFTLSEGEGTTVAKFTSAAADGFNSSEAFMAYYPCNAVTVNGSTITCIISAVQTYAANSFGEGTMPMAGYAANASGSVSFENLFGVVKLQLKGVADEKVESIEITSSNAVTGTSELTITESGKSISLSGTDAAAKKVVLDCRTDGVALDSETATDFLIALPAGATGLKVLINTTEASYYKEVPTENSSSEQINIVKAGNILKMPALNTAEMAPAYIENGVYYGDGIKLPKSSDGQETLIWAPVNCGYDENHKYGLLYQWGRKYGQGYDGETPAPSIVSGQLSSAEEGSSEANKNNFYTGDLRYSDWLQMQDDNLWYNNTSGASSIKTAYDPCPEGWRVPTNEELVSLVKGLAINGLVTTSGQLTNNSNDSNHSGLVGFWFYGNATPSEDGNKVFFPATGFRQVSVGSTNRNYYGSYWSSSSSVDSGSKAWSLYFTGDKVFSDDIQRVFGYSVRCVKD